MRLRSSSVACGMPMVQPIIRMIFSQYGRITKQNIFGLPCFCLKKIDIKTQLAYICRMWIRKLVYRTHKPKKILI